MVRLMPSHVYEAETIDQAVELAETLKARGAYDWFRGQNEPWPPHSSLFRILRQGNQRSISQAETQITEFKKWLHQTPGLESVAADPHAVLCIAQHYGIPTFYIDFTTEPGIAAFFACDSQRPMSAEAKRCIYCLNTQDLCLANCYFH